MMKKRLFMAIVLMIANNLLLTQCNMLPKPFESPVNSYKATPFASPLVQPLLPTPSSPAVATVGGRLLRDINGTIRPMAEAKIILAPVIRSANGTPVVASVDNGNKETALTTITDEKGEFIFVNVPPGTYSIVVATPIGFFLLQDVDGRDLLLDVQGGIILNLGEIRTSLPY